MSQIGTLPKIQDTSMVVPTISMRPIPKILIILIFDGGTGVFINRVWELPLHRIKGLPNSLYIMGWGPGQMEKLPQRRHGHGRCWPHLENCKILKDAHVFQKCAYPQIRENNIFRMKAPAGASQTKGSFSESTSTKWLRFHSNLKNIRFPKKIKTW